MKGLARVYQSVSVRGKFIRPRYIIRWAWKRSGKCSFIADRCYIIVCLNSKVYISMKIWRLNERVSKSVLISDWKGINSFVHGI